MACFHSGKVAVFDLRSGAMQWSYEPPSLKIPIRWTSDSRAILLAEHRDDVSNVWRHPIDGRAPKQITHFTSDNMWFFDISPDQKTVISSRGGLQSDAILVTGFH